MNRSITLPFATTTMRIKFYHKSWKACNLLFNKGVLLFLFILIPSLGNAQEQTYQGQVFDTEGLPLEFANVVALS